jgi:hypothetical protein
MVISPVEEERQEEKYDDGREDEGEVAPRWGKYGYLSSRGGREKVGGSQEGHTVEYHLLVLLLGRANMIISPVDIPPLATMEVQKFIWLELGQEEGGGRSVEKKGGGGEEGGS